MCKKQKIRRPESVGHMNIYIKKSRKAEEDDDDDEDDDEDDETSLEGVRFPVARYDRRRYRM